MKRVWAASQMSPGLAFIEGIEHFLHDSSRRLQIQGVGVGQLYHVGHNLLDLGRHLRPPGSELFVEFLGKLRHAVTVPRFTLPHKISPSEIGSETRQGPHVFKQSPASRFFSPASKFLLVHPRSDSLYQRKSSPGAALRPLMEHSVSRLPEN